MGEEQAKIHALNKIVSIIDEKASIYRNERKSMPSARAISEKKLILELIDDGMKLAKTIHEFMIRCFTRNLKTNSKG